MGLRCSRLILNVYRVAQIDHNVFNLMSVIVQDLLCDLSVVSLIVLFAGINRFFTHRDRVERYEDLTRRGYIVRF